MDLFVAKKKFINYLQVGAMIFSMTFGAGNVIYPLLTGYDMSSQGFSLFSLMGFICSSIIIPFCGFMATMFFRGKYLELLTCNSNIYFANFVTLISMLLLGPLGCIPRCALLAHSSIGRNFISISTPTTFAIFFLFLAMMFAWEKSNLIRFLSRILAPITIISLLIFIYRGFFLIQNLKFDFSPALFFKGFYYGNFTFDLLAMIFYSQVIYCIVEKIFFSKESESSLNNDESILVFLAKSAVVSGFFFTIIYGGMILVSGSNNSKMLLNLSGDQLFSEYSKFILGEDFALLQGLFIASACFSTSIALLVVFSDYLELLLRRSVSYYNCLIGSSLLSMIMVNLNFAKITLIMSFLIKISYPILMMIIMISFIKNFLYKSSSNYLP